MRIPACSIIMGSFFVVDDLSFSINQSSCHDSSYGQSHYILVSTCQSSVKLTGLTICRHHRKIASIIDLTSYRTLTQHTISSKDKPKRVAIFLPPGEGQPYPMGRISAVFKADGDETQSKVSDHRS